MAVDEEARRKALRQRERRPIKENGGAGKKPNGNEEDEKTGAKRRSGKKFSRFRGEKMANKMGKFPEAKQVVVKQEMIDQAET